jgi:hypothetical protein
MEWLESDMVADNGLHYLGLMRPELYRITNSRNKPLACPA